MERTEARGKILKVFFSPCHVKANGFWHHSLLEWRKALAKLLMTYQGAPKETTSGKADAIKVIVIPVLLNHASATLSGQLQM